MQRRLIGGNLNRQTNVSARLRTVQGNNSCLSSQASHTATESNGLPISGAQPTTPRNGLISTIFGRWGDMMHKHSHNSTLREDHENIIISPSVDSSVDPIKPFYGTTGTSFQPGSPLLAATNFRKRDSLNDIPSINVSEIVLPGSFVQQQMSQLMKSKSYIAEKSDEDECVICMETFDPTNPRMPTLCGCGENKTFFHLPCLYQWTEQHSECPSCREKLTWEEF